MNEADAERFLEVLEEFLQLRQTKVIPGTHSQRAVSERVDQTRRELIEILTERRA